MLKRLSAGQELGELFNTTLNTYVNAGNVPQFDFHQSDKSNVSFPLLSFLQSQNAYFVSSPINIYDGTMNRKLKRRLIYESRCDERLKSKTEGSKLLGYTGLWGTGTPNDRDEVNRPEVCECDG
jgi:hypothetical protein